MNLPFFCQTSQKLWIGFLCVGNKGRLIFPQITRTLCFLFSPKYGEQQYYIYGSVLLGMVVAVSVCFPGSGLF